jgi:hypothetical protein|tara:strand:- start:1309 stop:1425 length:117 start_codon:yes stop_codon:yes gene_type:complete
LNLREQPLGFLLIHHGQAAATGEDIRCGTGVFGADGMP